jgi:hypothetical protein
MVPFLKSKGNVGFEVKKEIPDTFCGSTFTGRNTP